MWQCVCERENVAAINAQKQGSLNYHTLLKIQTMQSCGIFCFTGFPIDGALGWVGTVMTPVKTTLQGTNISPKNGILKMIFLFPRWDMLVSWRVVVFKSNHSSSYSPKSPSNHLFVKRPWSEPRPLLTQGSHVFLEALTNLWKVEKWRFWNLTHAQRWHECAHFACVDEGV